MAAAPIPGSCTLVLLSFDERDALEKLLPLVPYAAFDRTIAIDPGSTDGSLELYRARGIEVVIQPERGRGNAFILAQNLVDTEHVIFFSTDGNEDVGDLTRILARLRAGYDMVIAGRFVLRGSETDMSDDPWRMRSAGAIAFGVLVRLIYRSGVWDSTNGYRGYRVAALQRLRLDAAGHDIEFQSTIRAAKLDLAICELPTRELARLGGVRKVTAGTFRLGWATLRCLLREIAIGRRFESRATLPVALPAEVRRRS